MSDIVKSKVLIAEALTGFIELENKVGGFANKLFDGLVALRKEKGLDNLLSDFNNAIAVQERELKSKLPDGVTLSEYSASFKSRKSDLKRAIRLGSDPNDYANFSQFVRSVSNTNKPKGDKPNTGLPVEVNNDTVIKLKAKQIELSRDNQERLDRILGLLEKLPQEQITDTLRKLEGNIHGRLRTLKKRVGQLHKLSNTG